MRYCISPHKRSKIDGYMQMKSHSDHQKTGTKEIINIGRSNSEERFRTYCVLILIGLFYEMLFFFLAVFSFQR